MDKSSKDISDEVKNLLNSEKLKIRALTSAGILVGSVIDIVADSSIKSKDKTFLDYLSNSNTIKIHTNIPSLTYIVKNTYLYPVSNLKTKVFLDIVELNSSKIIALCPAFEEVD